jgi:hypothetical protein
VIISIWLDAQGNPDREIDRSLVVVRFPQRATAARIRSRAVAPLQGGTFTILPADAA